METSHVDWSLRVTLGAPNIHLEQEREGLLLGQNWSKPDVSSGVSKGGSLPTFTAGSVFRCSEPTCSSSSW